MVALSVSSLLCSGSGVSVETHSAGPLFVWLGIIGAFTFELTLDWPVHVDDSSPAGMLEVSRGIPAAAGTRDRAGYSGHAGMLEVSRDISSTA